MFEIFEAILDICPNFYSKKIYPGLRIEVGELKALKHENGSLKIEVGRIVR